MKGIIYKFAPYASTTVEQAKETSFYALLERIDRGERIALEDLAKTFRELPNSERYRTGIVKWMGWVYDFRPYLTHYVVQETDGLWHDVWGYNKTAVRKLAVFPSRINMIIEIPKKRGRAA